MERKQWIRAYNEISIQLEDWTISYDDLCNLVGANIPECGSLDEWRRLPQVQIWMAAKQRQEEMPSRGGFAVNKDDHEDTLQTETSLTDTSSMTIDCVSWSSDDDSIEAEGDIFKLKSSKLSPDSQQMSVNDYETKQFQSDKFSSETPEMCIYCGSCLDAKSIEAQSEVISAIANPDFGQPLDGNANELNMNKNK
jgi:NAD-dependent dihydropyrimidine dehydrogenase PreA subunit